MKLGEKLVRLRKIKGLTQDEFAKAVGVSRQAVYKWESEQSYPEVPKLLEIKNLFGISIDDLLDESFEIALPEKKKRKRSERNTEIATAPAVDIPAPAPVIEPADTVENKEEIPTPAVVDEAPVANISEKEEEEPTSAEEKAEPQKKVGFFGRLFGRR